MQFENTLEGARRLDEQDELRKYRDRYHLPTQSDGQPYLYLCGNSLGLQPKSTGDYIQQELADWKRLGVEGHFHAKRPWMPYHEFLTQSMADVVGGKPSEVVVMNTLSVNLHLMMVSFYRPTEDRFKIIIESDAFPSDKYAVESQLRFHGYDPKEALVELTPRQGETLLREQDIVKTIQEHGGQTALIMLGVTNYYTGQLYNMKLIADLGHDLGAMVGYDCAHGAGNVELNLHDTGADFAVWCTYKYLNSGPGSLGGCFIHERHHQSVDIPRFAGWWGQNKVTRFGMRDGFDPIATAEGWQLSNPPILSMAAIMASLELFAEVGMARLRKKAKQLTSYLEYVVEEIQDDRIGIITPSDVNQRGSQLSIQVKEADKRLFEAITEAGIIADWREPDVIRVAPTAMYNSYEDVYRFAQILKKGLASFDKD